MTDTTRKDMVGCYGNKKMITPNLDALAQEGIRYENAYTCQPVCGPREVQFLQVHFLIQMAWLRMGFHWGQM